jgi:hypothetical protein
VGPGLRSGQLQVTDGCRLTSFKRPIDVFKLLHENHRKLKLQRILYKRFTEMLPVLCDYGIFVAGRVYQVGVAGRCG